MWLLCWWKWLWCFDTDYVDDEDADEDYSEYDDYVYDGANDDNNYYYDDEYE